MKRQHKSKDRVTAGYEQRTKSPISREESQMLEYSLKIPGKEVLLQTVEALEMCNTTETRL